MLIVADHPTGFDMTKCKLLKPLSRAEATTQDQNLSNADGIWRTVPAEFGEF